MRIEGLCYLPLVRGLYKRLEGRVPNDVMLRDEETVDAAKVLKLFVYGYCVVDNEDEEECVCGHTIKNLFFVHCPAIDEHVVVGSCCIARWLDKKMASAAQHDLKHQTKILKFKQHPESHCAWCGKSGNNLNGRLVHKVCRWPSYNALLETSRQTGFIQSMIDRKTTRPGFVSEKQWLALTDPRWWSPERRIDLFRKSPHCYLTSISDSGS